MSLTDLFVSQIIDPFRIALLIGLVITMQRTRMVTGTLLPLAAGIAFVAIIIPTTLTQGIGAPMLHQVGMGVVSNALILAIILGIRAALVRTGRIGPGN
jgi:hypothetical protein